MSDLSSDFDNDNLSVEVDITGCLESTDSTDSIDLTVDLAGQARRTPYNFPGI